MRRPYPRIAVIGAGLGGLCMAIKLREAGYTDCTVYEKAGSVGGTWRDNTYPGIACDVPSHLYSYSFELNPDWSHAYSPGEEIQAYTLACVDKHGVAQQIRFGKEITRCRFADGCWQLESADGEAFEADVLVSAIGGLHIPSLPDIPGREDFAGAAFHTARWDHDAELAGKRIAVIGSAASAVQVVPEIAKQAAQLYVFQRTPNWIIPRGDKRYSAFRRACLEKVPGLARAYRWLLFWLAESRWPAFRENSLASRFGKLWPLWHLRRQVPDKALRAKLEPDYPLGCKRILRSDDYYPTLLRGNVELVTEPIARIEPDAIVGAAGDRREVDVIVYATGFNVFDVTGGVEIAGAQGQSLAERWAGGIEAHRTIAVPGFPNFFMLMGPNSALGHNSVIFMIEAQVRYIIQCLDALRSRGWRTMEPKREAFERYEARLLADLDKTVWTGGCSSWYQDAHGRVFTLWPHTATRYWRSLRKVDISEYRGSP